MTGPLGVGIIGAGAVTQGIHLPALATLADRIRVAHLMDVDEDTARAVAARAEARYSTELEGLLDDPAVDIVAVCSPPELHADQVVAAVAAGKKAVLCEKPLATTAEDAHRIADVSMSSGVPVVVGTMHSFDPAWTAARPHLADLADSAHLVRSAIYLPHNDEFVQLATELHNPAPPSAMPVDPDPEFQADLIKAGVLGLGIHAIPQIRFFLPQFERVTAVRFVAPFGYRLILTGPGCTAELTAITPGQWAPDWTLDVRAESGALRVTYPPAFVQAGSATVTKTGPDGNRCWHYPTNGYQAEWEHLADLAHGHDDPVVRIQTAVDDLLYAIQLADQAAAAIMENA